MKTEMITVIRFERCAAMTSILLERCGQVDSIRMIPAAIKQEAMNPIIWEDLPVFIIVWRITNENDATLIVHI